MLNKLIYIIFLSSIFFNNILSVNAISVINENQGIYECDPGPISPYEDFYINYLYIAVAFISIILLFRGFYLLLDKKSDKIKGRKYILYSLSIFFGFYIFVEFLLVPFLIKLFTDSVF